MTIDSNSHIPCIASRIVTIQARPLVVVTQGTIKYILGIKQFLDILQRMKSSYIQGKKLHAI